MKWVPKEFGLCATQCFMNSLRAGIIAMRVDAAAALFPGVIAAPLMLGTLAASGGKLCVDAIMQLYGKPAGGVCPAPEPL